jgi:GT2 family glycosyltransferase
METCPLSLVIPTRPERLGRLLSLLEDVAQSGLSPADFEVVLVLDDWDDSPLRVVRDRFSERLRIRGLTQRQAGPAQARNRGIEAACGQWLLSLDDDIRLGRGTLLVHLEAIRRDPQARCAYLGEVAAPPETLDSPWQHLVAESAMVFFPKPAHAMNGLGFRYFWSGHISVRRDLVQAVGGFDPRFPHPMHEDIELGWRLQRRFGLRVHALPGAAAWHHHALCPRTYLLREARSGSSAAAAAEINRAFHHEVWPWCTDAQRDAFALRRLLMRSARETLALLEEWAKPCSRVPAPTELHAAYLAHLPLKRLTFLHGYLGEPFDRLWDELHAHD